MNLEKINNASFIIKDGTNIGVYVFEDNSVLLIDTGYKETKEEEINNILKENNLTPKHIICTHSHHDHDGGNEYFKNHYPNILTYTSKKEKVFMENKELLNYILFNSAPPKTVFKDTKSDVVDVVLNCGINIIGDEKFNIISLKGHSPDQIGVVTPDRVCFLADSLYSSKVLDTYFFPYTIDLKENIMTLQSMNTIDADYFVLSHSKDVINKDELNSVVQKNLKNIDKFLDIIYNLLRQPLSKEQIVKNIIMSNHRELSKRLYFVTSLAVSAYLSYLCNTDKVDMYLEDGMMYYSQK